MGHTNKGKTMFTTYYLSPSGKALITVANKPGPLTVNRGNVFYKRFSIARNAGKTVCKQLVVEYSENGDLIVK